MPAGNHERDMGETGRGHSAVCAMATPFTALKHMHFTVEYGGRSTKSPQDTHGVCTPRPKRIVTPTISGVLTQYIFHSNLHQSAVWAMVYNLIIQSATATP